MQISSSDLPSYSGKSCFDSKHLSLTGIGQQRSSTEATEPSSGSTLAQPMSCLTGQQEVSPQSPRGTPLRVRPYMYTVGVCIAKEKCNHNLAVEQ